ncbi:MAG: sulfatase-like hydrolase/transferase [Verrucomicrobiia bacterium]
MSNRSFPGSRFAALLVLLLPLFFLSSSRSVAGNRFAASGQERPNILFLFSDDQTFRTLGLLGELEVKTPTLDRLAQRGMLFTHCFNQGGWSGAVCIPSRTMLNTGRMLWQCRGRNDQGLPEGVALWGETLGKAGYDTYMAGKWHLPDAALGRSFRTLGPLTGGFLPSTTNAGPAYFRPASENSWTPNDAVWKGHWLDVDGKIVHSSTRIADAAIRYLTNTAARATNPFFMYVAFNAPHDPRQAPREHLDLYPPAQLKLPPNFLPTHPFPIEPGPAGRDEILAPFPRTHEIVRVHLQEYYAIISHMDAEIGRVLKALETSGKADNTIVIFTSDQGLAVGQHGLLGKQNLYDHSLRVPFIIAGPGVPQGNRCAALFYLQSAFATTCELAGVPVPDTVQFPSIAPLITGDRRDLHDALYAAYLDRQRAVRTADWKLIRTPHANRVQLFNVKEDPWEVHNLAPDPKHATTIARLDATLRELMREMKDPLPEEKVFASRSLETAAVGSEAVPGKAPERAPGRKQPNIVFVLTDDQGYGDLGWTGNPVLRTPQIDSFARHSVRFTDFHVSPTCAPTRSALMTGRHEFMNGVTHTIYERERMALGATTLAQVLKKAGYSTGIFGKWHLGDEPPYQPGRRGFEESFIHGAGGIGQTYPGSCGDAPGNTYFDPVILHNGQFVKTTGYCTDVFFTQALTWMDEQRSRGTPFFALITPNAPHAPLDCPGSYARRHQGQVPDNAAKFFGMIENIDDNFGALLTKLDSWGIASNTLVIFMTDNGGTAGVQVYNAGMRGGKGTPYQGGTRVPSFWRWPAEFKGGADCPALTAHIDVFPTLAEIAGVPLEGEVAAQVVGRSLLPLLTDPQARWPDRFLVTHLGRWDRGRAAESRFRNCSIRNGRFTLVNNVELYDLERDPSETTNVIDYHPETVANLRAAYDQWWQGIQPMLVNEDVPRPKVNAFKELYWQQFGGGPDEALRRQMDPP